jgi:hypothetical protein
MIHDHYWCLHLSYIIGQNSKSFGPLAHTLCATQVSNKNESSLTTKEDISYWYNDNEKKLYITFFFFFYLDDEV